MDQNKVLVLRTCASDLSAYNGFKWSESGEVSAPDWSPRKVCGFGLHGLLWGCGDGTLLNHEPEAKWLVVEVDAASVVELDGKVKFPKGEVLFCGDRKGATEMVASRAPQANLPIVGLSITAGDSGTATAGDSGTATAGDSGTATAGVGGTATAGDSGTATAGYYGTATAGSYGTATAGDSGTATAGDSGTATAGSYGTATAGDSGTATAGYSGTATAGVGGTATAGDSGTATAGVGGTLIIKRFDPIANRYRIVTGYVGEDGIEANVPYVLDANGKLARKAV